MTTSADAAPTHDASLTVPPDEAARTRALDRFFESYYRLRPVNATFIGMHDFDHLLPDWSPEGLSAARREMSELRRTLAAAGLGVLDDAAIRERDWQAIDGALADAFLEIELSELTTLHFQRGNPSLAVGEALFGVIALMTRPFAGIERRGGDAASRLRAFPLFLVGVRRTMETTPVPDAWRARALRECEGGAILLEHIQEWLDAEGAPSSVRDKVRAAVGVAREGLAWFASFLRDRPAAGPGRYRVGASFLELLLRRGHWLDASVESLRREAHESLLLAAGELQAAVREAGAHDWTEVQEQLASRAPTPDRFLEAFEETWRASRSLALERNLITWPDIPIRYVPIPPWARQAAPYLYYLHYRAPAPLDQVPIVDYAVAPLDAAVDAPARDLLLRTWNDSVIKLNHVVHHGGIGHHVQNWSAYRAPSRIGRVAAVDCAARIAMFCGGSMAEGWACYATDLMEEAGFLTPLERAAQQATRVRLLARAVVDLELHGGRMDLEDAIALYETQVGMSPAAARGEAVKNSMFPGTACMYWLGTRAIHRLRRERAQSLGDRFSLREFHDELLGLGSIPVALAARVLGARAGSRR